MTAVEGKRSFTSLSRHNYVEINFYAYFYNVEDLRALKINIDGNTIPFSILNRYMEVEQCDECN